MSNFNLVTYKKIIIVSCIICMLLGVFLHFAYGITNNNALVGLITPVNESVWEHLKLIFIPFTIFSIIFYFITGKRFNNTFLICLLGNVVSMFSIVSLYYIGYLFNIENSMVYNIITYIISVILAFYVFYLGLYNKEFFEETKDSLVLGICALSLMFTLFITNTYSPFKAHITLDPITKTYGKYQSKAKI